MRTLRFNGRWVPWMLLLLVAGLAPSADSQPLKVLLLSGQNNHVWQETTPKLQAILEKEGRFKVEVLEAPQTMTRESIADYGVILSNWNNWGDAAVKEWPPAARDAFIEFVSGGKGFVSVHAGSSSFYDWPDYQTLAITAWDLANTGHGKQHHFNVSPSAVDHPITRGMVPFMTFDELWHRVPVPPDAQILATAYSSPDFKGTGRDEPILFTKAFGQGRSVNFLLGHHVRAMSNPAFAELLLRAVDWAATGGVNRPVPVLEWVQSDAMIALKRDGEVLWQFNFGADAPKPYFHPLAMAGVPALTWNAPPDHAWHHGLWFSWKFINGVNFWEENPETGKSDGKTCWDRPEITTAADGSASIHLTLRYESEPQKAVLEESRTIAVSAPDWLGAYALDWHATFTALAPEVLLDRTPIMGEPEGKTWGGYAGLSLRLSDLATPEVHTELGPLPMDEPQANVDADSMDFSGLFDGNACGVAILSGEVRDKKPIPWYAIAQADNEFYYFSPALLFRGVRTLKAAETLDVNYRIVLHPGTWSNTRLAGELSTRNVSSVPIQPAP